MQKASFGKRIIAAIFDGILVSILAVGLATLLSVILKYDGYMNRVNAAYDKYEAEYGIEFQISQDEYENLTDEKREAYDTAYEALKTDKDVLYNYNMLINLTLLILTFSVLIGVIASLSEIPYEKWVETIKTTVPEKFLEVNLKAFDLGYKGE